MMPFWHNSHMAGARIALNIDRIEIKNFRCFAEAQIDFDPNLTVFIAHNGQGKSALLDAIRVALWPYVAGFDLGSTTNDTTGIQTDDVRRVQVRAHEMEPRTPSVIVAKGHIATPNLMLQMFPDSRRELSWSEIRTRSSIHRNAKTKNMKLGAHKTLSQCAAVLQEQVFSNSSESQALPIVAYYGADRGGLPRPQSSMKLQPEIYSKTSAYRNCLASSAKFSQFATWFQFTFLDMRNSQLRNLEKNLPLNTGLSDDTTAHIEVVRQAVNQVLTKHTGWKDLSYSSVHGIVLNHEEQGELKVSQLSDGIRSILALAGDIAFRCHKLNPHYGKQAAQLTAGIVMIDEIDLHLHPEWQQTILTDLQTAFPQIQFIVTTHSPQVLTTVPAHCIRQLESEYNETAGQRQTVARTVEQQTQGIPSSDVLAEVMGVNPVPDVEAARQLNRYHALIAQGLHENLEGQELRRKLDVHFGRQHPRILDCERAIRFQAFKQRLPARTGGDA